MNDIITVIVTYNVGDSFRNNIYKIKEVVSEIIVVDNGSNEQTINMLREINLDEISDGRLYSSNDMAKTDCKGCDGCSACCHGMGNSIVLDPLDVYRLSTNLSKSVNELLTGPLELNVVDGIILPNLKMARAEEACSFLDTNGRCTVHAFRPGICRMFPLGRFYENRSFQYFLQIHECPKTDRSKVKIKKWLDTPNLKTYEKYIADWHFFLKDLQEYVMNLAFDSSANSDGTARTISMHVLTQFYLTPYPEDGDFYSEFYKRLEKSRLFTQSIGI